MFHVFSLAACCLFKQDKLGISMSSGGGSQWPPRPWAPGPLSPSPHKGFAGVHRAQYSFHVDVGLHGQAHVLLGRDPEASIKFGDNGEVIVTGGPPENAKAGRFRPN